MKNKKYKLTQKYFDEIISKYEYIDNYVIDIIADGGKTTAVELAQLGYAEEIQDKEFTEAEVREMLHDWTFVRTAIQKPDTGSEKRHTEFANIDKFISNFKQQQANKKEIE